MRKRSGESLFWFGILLIIYGIIVRFTPTVKVDHALLVYIIVLVTIMIWSSIGYFVILLIDDENNSLANWVNDAPLWFSHTVPIFFPVFLFYYIKNKRGGL